MRSTAKAVEPAGGRPAEPAPYRVVLLGNNDGPLRIARALRNVPSATVAAVLLQKPPADGAAAAYADLPCGTSVAPTEAAALPHVRALAPDLLVNAFANYRFRDLLSVAPCLNLHLGPLPRYRGRHPMHWGLINGETRFGVSLHRMTAAFDDGPILWRAEVDVGRGWSVAQLRAALMAAVDEGVGAALAAVVAGTARERPNPLTEGAYVPRRRPADSALREWADPDRVVRKVLALRSEAYPATVAFGGVDLALCGARVLTRGGGAHEETPILRARPDGDLDVAYANGTTLRLHAAPTTGADRDGGGGVPRG